MMRMSPLSSQVWNCEHSLEFCCPQRWDALTPTGDPQCRHCSVCDQDVVWCSSVEEFIHNARCGRCVAIPTEVVPGKADTCWLGRPSQEEVRKLEDERSQSRAWWSAIVAQDVPFVSPIADELRHRFGQPPKDKSPQRPA